ALIVRAINNALNGCANAEIRPLNRVVHVGDTVQLATLAVNDTSDHSWRLRSRPETSHAVILDPHGGQASFLADVPGAYEGEVPVRVGSESVTLTMTVSTSCATDPLTPVNTIDMVNGVVGMTVGPCFFAENKPTQLQVVYLYRNGNNALTAYNVKNSATGMTSANQGYDVTVSGISAMQADFSTLPTNGSVLVFVALPASAGTVSSLLYGQPSCTPTPTTNLTKTPTFTATPKTPVPTATPVTACLESPLAKIGGVVPS